MEPLWTPSAERVEASNLTKFMRALSTCLGRELKTYDELHAWSVENPADFWAFYTAYADIDLSSGPKTVMSDDPMPHTKWFEGAALNYAKELLYPPALGDDAQAALICVTETGAEQRLSYAELRAEVARCAAALKREGVRRGDRVSAFATNTPETVVAFLACSSLGAVFSSCSPDFGLDAAQARFGQIEPKVLFASPLYYYNGKRFDTLETVESLAKGIPSLEGVVLLPYPGEPSTPLDKGDRISEALFRGDLLPRNSARGTTGSSPQPTSCLNLSLSTIPFTSSFPRAPQVCPRPSSTAPGVPS